MIRLIGCFLIMAFSGCMTKKTFVNLTDMTINYLPHISVDASDADWKECADVYSFFVDKFGYSDTSDFSADLKLAWSEQGLTLLTDVNDDLLQTNKKNSDRIEIFISPQKGSNDVIQYIFSGLNDSSKFTVNKYTFRSNEPEKNIQELRTSIQKKRRGFRLEVLIPKESLGFALSDSSKFYFNIVFADADSSKVHSYPLFINDNTYSNLFALENVGLSRQSKNSGDFIFPRVWTVDKDSVFIRVASDNLVKENIEVRAHDKLVPFQYRKLAGVYDFGQVSFKRSDLDNNAWFDLIMNKDSAIYYFRDIPNLRVNQKKINKYDDDIDLFEEYDKWLFPSPKSVLFTGSSSVRLWRSLKTDFPELSCINRGFGGSCTADVIYYFNRIIKPYNPSKIVLFTGSNDLNKGMEPEQVVADYKKFIELVQKELPRSHLIILSIKISINTKKLQQTIEKTNILLKKLVARYPGIDFVDVIPLMTDKTGAPLPELFCGDSTHMNEKGYKRLTEFLKPYMIK